MVSWAHEHPFLTFLLIGFALEVVGNVIIIWAKARFGGRH